jgi:acyl carrier protein
LGIDFFEIVLEVEDKFGITIRDAEAQNVRTVGDLLTVINSRMAGAATACPSLTAFLQVRRVTRDFLSQSTLRLRPTTSIASIIPVRRRREFWRAFGKLSGSTPPALRRPGPLRILLTAVASIALVLGFGTAFIDPAILPLGVISALGFILALYLLTSPMCVEPPAKLTTFGDLSRRLVGLTTATRPIASADEVLSGVRKIVVDALGVEPEEVVPEARFIEDLNME